MRTFLLIALSILAAWTLVPNRSFAATTETKYYFGDVVMSSADGRIPYGKTISLVQRIIDPAANQITEIVLQPSRSPQAKPTDITTTLTRVGASTVFSAVDTNHTFDGKLVFSGDEWAWNQWTYDIALKDGSKLKGTGLLDSEGIKTEKTFYKPDGAASVLLKENLKEITRQEYDERHRQMRPK